MRSRKPANIMAGQSNSEICVCNLTGSTVSYNMKILVLLYRIMSAYYLKRNDITIKYHNLLLLANNLVIMDILVVSYYSSGIVATGLTYGMPIKCYTDIIWSNTVRIKFTFMCS